MAQQRNSIHGEWSSRWAFILAATGSAVGLGNIWKFPYITGANGGGAFVIVYLLCIVAIGIPIMIAEIMIGRRGRRNPIHTLQLLAEEAGAHPRWRYLGGMGVLAGFLILSYYSVIGGWVLAYVFRTASGVFDEATAEGVATVFQSFVGQPMAQMVWHTIFMIMTMVVVSRGVQSGLEKAARFLMPGLFVLLFVLVGYAMTTDSFGDGVRYLFQPDFAALTAKGVLIAMGHAFFTLSLGMGAIMIYGSYLSHNESIVRTTLTIVAADTAVSLLAGLAIFPIVFANNLEPGAGPGLIFQTLPLAFGHMPAGTFFGVLFFIMVVFAAWTSSISLIEPAITWMVERHSLTRPAACVISGVLTWALGIGTVLSFNDWSDVRLFGKTFFDLLDFLTASIMLPLGGLCIAIFAAWVMLRETTLQELAIGDGTGYRIWRFLIRYVTPLAVIVVFASGILNAIGVVTL
ncbi:MAG: neurotransmitter:Na+ symporter NSS family [Gammaproteobacteria bacterium]|nr:MAG: neurotransmitter:Na+ symporter NSS family [Gammaproteobacteria bacterium]TND04760.1 MAG: neurotransmitter:Na+ symporter, NSS family [Gammaproteobacteria bacterium]